MPTKEEAKKAVVEAVRKLYNSRSSDNNVFQGNPVAGRILTHYHPKYVSYLEQIIAEAVLSGKIIAEDPKDVRLEDRKYDKDIERQIRQGKKKD